MKNRIYLKNNQKNKKRKLIILSIFLIIILIILIHRINNNISKLLFDYSKTELEKISYQIINEIDTDKYLDHNNLYTISKDKNNNIESIDYNTQQTNKLLTKITNEISKKFNKLENNNKSLKVPLGALSNSILLKNIGPKIPIKFELYGYIKSNIKIDVKNYGINNCLLEVKLNISITAKIILPISSKIVTTTQETPISAKLIQGQIPNIYQDGRVTTKSYNLPIN